MAPSKSVLITGCSDGGMGASLALAFHKRGDFRVVATARNLSKMAKLKSEGIELLSLDVQSAKSIAQCVQATSKLLNGKLDMLINNSGAGYSMPLMDVELDKMRQVFDLNVFSLVSTTQAFLPLLRASTNPVVVNHTSLAAIYGPPNQSVYNSSKAAAAMVTHNLRQELGAFDIKVVELKTGNVKTNFFSNVDGTKLPDDSIYKLGKDVIEDGMGGSKLSSSTDMTADAWADLVVADLAKSNPPYEIWQGTRASWLKLLTWLPGWLWDGLMKELMGLDVFEKRYKAQRAGLKVA